MTLFSPLNVTLDYLYSLKFGMVRPSISVVYGCLKHQLAIYTNPLNSIDHISCSNLDQYTLSLQHITGKRYQPAYLATNQVGDDETTNTLRISQEAEDSLSFEWNKMEDEKFKHVTIGIDEKYSFDESVDISEGEIGLLDMIGKACEKSKYYAEGYRKGYFNFGSVFQSYELTYIQAPRITNVSINNSLSYVTWEQKTPSCKLNYTTIMFIGTLTKPLEMIVFGQGKNKFELPDLTDDSRSRKVLLLTNRLDNRYSLPIKVEMMPEQVNNQESNIKQKPEKKEGAKVEKSSSTTPLSLQHITGKRYQPAYLATNQVGDDETTNTLRISQEGEDSLSFEWNKMEDEKFKHVTIGIDRTLNRDYIVNIYKGEIGLLDMIGKACAKSKYYAEGYRKGYLNFNSVFQRYELTYIQAPRITNVSINNSLSYVTWEQKTPSCKLNYTTIMFIGTLTKPLEMIVVGQGKDKFKLPDLTDDSRSRKVLLLTNRLDNRYSLPIKGNIFVMNDIYFVILCIRLYVHNMLLCKNYEVVCTYA
ncbi:hypothetical protein KSF78_0009261 [Schistosoma japonicum]|nr:hypothetical protein KSF78_0009261 [Schistosoma japonicum]